MGVKNPIILIDDDEDDRYIFQEAFNKSGCKNPFLQFDSGAAFLDYLENTEDLPSLVLLDLNMPLMDGREILKKIRTVPKWNAMPVIVFTTSSFDKDRDLSYQLGANCFISKPTAYQEILDITKSISLLWCLR